MPPGLWSRVSASGGDNPIHTFPELLTACFGMTCVVCLGHPRVAGKTAAAPGRAASSATRRRPPPAATGPRSVALVGLCETCAAARGARPGDAGCSPRSARRGALSCVACRQAIRPFPRSPFENVVFRPYSVRKYTGKGEKNLAEGLVTKRRSPAAGQVGGRDPGLRHSPSVSQPSGLMAFISDPCGEEQDGRRGPGARAVSGQRTDTVRTVPATPVKAERARDVARPRDAQSRTALPSGAESDAPTARSEAVALASGAAPRPRWSALDAGCRKRWPGGGGHGSPSPNS